ncbi:MAG: HEAT repeat domain-containing protein, partial [Verrucomicrobia bacterium]|nr:HEAT repeat domain-containing protein [Verrucomicrobiota bacterium]
MPCLALSFIFPLLTPQGRCVAGNVVYPEISESVARLSAPDEYVQERGISDLVGMGKAAAPAYDILISVALSSDNLPKIRSGAAQALRNIDEARAAIKFIGELTNCSPTAREYAVDALMIITRPEAALPLIDRLRDDNEQVRHRAGIALQFYKGAELGASLMTALTNKDDKARTWAPWLLGRMKYEPAVQPLIELLADDNVSFRQSVIAALRDMKAKQA